MSGFTTRGQWALTGRDSRRIVSSLDEDGADNSRSNKSSMNVSCSNMNMHYSALHMHIRVRVRVIWGGTRFELMSTSTRRSQRQSTYLHLLLFRGSPQGEKQKERSQWPGRDHHQTATPPRCSLSMPSPAPWSRTSPPDPDLTAKSTFFSSALRGGIEQTVAVPAVQGCRGRLSACSKAEMHPSNERVEVRLVRRPVVRAGAIFENGQLLASVSY